MTAIGRTNYAFFFDGVSDSIVVPDGAFKSLGDKNPEGNYDVREILGTHISQPHTALTTNRFQNGLVIEAWVMPDCGGTVIEKEGQFKLTVGNVDTPGPAMFEVTLANKSNKEFYKISTASDTGTRYEGTVYPSSTFGGIHDYYNRFDTVNYGTATDMNKSHRPLLHIVASFQVGKSIDLYVNGILMARKSIRDASLVLADVPSHVYIGGKGGEYRGVIEGIQIGSALTDGIIEGNCPLKGPSTSLLYRFEEPISPIETTFTFSNLTGGYDGNTLSTLTLDSTDAQALAKALTGNTVTTGSVDFTKKPYSAGHYEVYDTSTGTTILRYVAHVPYNLLINPGSVNPNTKKPNKTPPERVRLHSINVETGVLTGSSIHLDHQNDTNGGLIGVINKTRTTDVDNHFVVIGADLLIDTATGNPYLPPHYNSQIIDRTGQMILDESGLDTHGFVFSSRMATTINDVPAVAATASITKSGDGINNRQQ